MFIGFMSSRAGLVTTFEMLKLTAFCGLLLFTHGKIYLLHFMWCLLQLMLIILTIGEKSALTLIVSEEAYAQARWVSHLRIQ